jgi:hypothetical protein
MIFSYSNFNARYVNREPDFGSYQPSGGNRNTCSISMTASQIAEAPHLHAGLRTGASALGWFTSPPCHQRKAPETTTKYVRVANAKPRMQMRGPLRFVTCLMQQPPQRVAHGVFAMWIGRTLLINVQTHGEDAMCHPNIMILHACVA